MFAFCIHTYKGDQVNEKRVVMSQQPLPIISLLALIGFGVFSKTFFLQINTSLFIRSARLVSLLFRPSLLRSSLIPLRTPSPLSLPIPIGWRGVNAPAGITKRRQFVHNCEAQPFVHFLFFGTTVDDGAGSVRLSAAGCFFGT